MTTEARGRHQIRILAKVPRGRWHTTQQVMELTGIDYSQAWSALTALSKLGRLDKHPMYIKWKLPEKKTKGAEDAELSG